MKNVTIAKPITEIQALDAVLYEFYTSVDGKYVIREISVTDGNQIITKLKAGRLYRTKLEVINVIETITGLPYVEN